jgi:hypothetical protein
MRWTTTPEVRLDARNAASSGPARQSVLPLRLSTGSAAIEFRCGGPPRNRKLRSKSRESGECPIKWMPHDDSRQVDYDALMSPSFSQTISRGIPLDFMNSSYA